MEHNMDKAEMTIQTIFYILMAVVFIALLIFAYNKIFVVKEAACKVENLEIEQEIEEALLYLKE